MFRRKRRLRRARERRLPAQVPNRPSHRRARRGRAGPGATVYHAGTRLEEGVYKTAGGRVLGVTCTAPTAGEALRNAYRAAEGIRFEGVHFRRDIGARNHR
ncbi:MAG: phosphoribosylglycinamide synthetase C domain-containing protein [Anaerotruncus massiliensis (ex Togo et al. 2019)]